VSLLTVGDVIEPVIAQLRTHPPDLVFNLTESFKGKSALDSALAGLLNLLGLRYTGSSPSGLMLAGDKILAKKMLRFHGVRTPEFATVYRGALDHAGDLSFPLIVKPPQEDASLGITERSVVRDVRELLGRMDEMQQAYQQPVLVEEFIVGREFYVGVLGNANAEALPVVELDFTGDASNTLRIASWDVKWGEADGAADAPAVDSVVAIGLADELVARMQSTAVEAFHALRLRDYARIDLRVNEAGDAYVIEVNPNCYLDRKGEFAMAAAAAGIGYDDLVARIVELAAARYAR
jgi:D-alanine-D-alanine ligase